MALVQLLSACAPTPERGPTPGEQLRDAHRAQVEALSDWSVAGRIAVKAEDEGYHGNLNWRQRGEDFDLRVSGPFAQGTLRLQGDDHRVTLSDGSGGGRSAADGDTLMAEATGLKVPVAGLRYWVRGLSAPGPLTASAGAAAAAEARYDDQGRLQQLDQNGWAIVYRAYSEVGGIALPRKVFLERPGLSVRLVVDRWQL